MTDRSRKTGGCAGRIAGLAALLCLPPGAAAPSETEETPKAVETPRTAQFGGVSIGMAVAELGRKLESQGFRHSEKKLRRYIDDAGDVKKRIRYRELPGPDGAPTIYELDYTEWYPAGTLDADRFQAEVRKRFGEPYQVRTSNVGSREMIYVEVAGGPTVVDVANACQAEIQKKTPPWTPPRPRSRRPPRRSTTRPTTGSRRSARAWPRGTARWRSFSRRRA